MSLEEYNFSEAKMVVVQIRETLEQHKISPYAISTSGVETINAHTSVYVETDIPTGVSGEAGRYPLVQHNSWDAPYFVLIIAGLIDNLPHTWSKQIYDWGWTDPEIWQQERLVWRQGQNVVMSATEADKLRTKALTGSRFKRKWERLQCAWLDVVLKDDEDDDGDSDDDDDDDDAIFAKKKPRLDEGERGSK